MEATGAERVADRPDIIDPSDVRVPSYFVSHAWCAPSHLILILTLRSPTT